MTPHLSSLLVVLQALAAATTSFPGNCDGGGEQEMAVEGWPVMVALRIPDLAQTKMTLKLSHNDEVHTTLTLDQFLRESASTCRTHPCKTGVLQVRLESVMIRSPLNTATQLPGTSWATLMIFAQAKELKIMIMSETRSVKYSTSASVSTIHHKNVNKVSCLGENCASFIDLKCRYSGNKSNHNEPHKPNSIASTSDKTVYYWVIYVAVSLLVVACLLFLVWRNEREKFRMRWSRHSQTVRRMASVSVQEGGSWQADGTNETGEWRPGTNLAISNPAYDKSGDSD